MNAALEHRRHATPQGDLHYWATPADRVAPDAPWLVFLPGLTADHRLFDQQVEHFAASANCLVWDAPAHGLSRPWPLTFSLDDLAALVHDLLAEVGAARPVLVGQSLGGYIAQAFMDLHPGEAHGFVSIDSAPLKRSYFKEWELWALRHTRLMYLSIPWKLLLRWGSNGCATTEEGRSLMRAMMDDYGKVEYCNLAAHGYRALADAADSGRTYAIDCPALLICGSRDAAGSARDYNRRWTATEGLPLVWIEGAGHNSNTDRPQEVNRLIEEFVHELL